jgi:bifunctional DNase/RNase
MATTCAIRCALGFQAIENSIKYSIIKRDSIPHFKSQQFGWNMNQHFGLSLKMHDIKKAQQLAKSTRGEFNIQAINKDSKSTCEEKDKLFDHYLKVEVLNVWGMIESSTKTRLVSRNDKEVEVEYLNNRNLSSSRPKEHISHALALKVFDGSNVILSIATNHTRIFPILGALGTNKTNFLPCPSWLKYFTNILETSHMELRRVMITHKDGDIYQAKVYKAWKGHVEEHSVDAKHVEDAIEIALWKNLPIYVNRNLFYDNGLRIVRKDEIDMIRELNVKKQNLCLEKMPLIPDSLFMEMQFQIAITEERYNDAARWKKLSDKKYLEYKILHVEKNDLDEDLDEDKSYISL